MNLEDWNQHETEYMDCTLAKLWEGVSIILNAATWGAQTCLIRKMFIQIYSKA